MSSINPVLWKFYQNLILLRRNSQVLSEGKLVNLKRLSPHVISFERKLGARSLTIKLDFKAREVLLPEKLF
ncbi:MAG TPA: hypothetical protein VNJ08_10640 [Bacteriovoracaceae bacterium]|nr:hypothetical protein [Bacteriovoracaceae bacterium]